MDNEAFKDEVEINENMIGEKNGQNKIPLWARILIPCLIILIIIIVIVIILVNSKESKKKYISLKCIYDIQSISESIQLISKEFSENIETTMIINGTERDFNQSLIFEEIGLTNIEFHLYESKLNMNNLFKNIYTLISIEINSNDEDTQIISMASSFQGCTNLKDVKISNIKTDQLKSMHKLFYNSNSLSSVNLGEINTKNVEDMSYLFAFS